MHRQISFSDRFVRTTTDTNVYCRAVAIGDVTNEGFNEFVFGTWNGTISVFKGLESFWDSHMYSSIKCVTIGDVLNLNHNCIVFATSEGDLFIIDLVLSLKLSFVISPNISSLLVTKIDEKNDLFVGTSDRKLFQFHFEESTNEIRENRLYAKTVPLEHPPFPKAVGELPTYLADLKKTWELAGQINTLSLAYGPNRERVIAIGMKQSNVSPVVLIDTKTGSLSNFNPYSDNMKVPVVDNDNPLPYTAEVVSPLLLADNRTYGVGISILADGSIINTSLEVNKEERLNKTISINARPLVSLSSCDFTGKGYDDVIACTWYGMTYIIDRNGNIACFDFNERVLAFCAGPIYISKSRPHSLCLIYISFLNDIVVYTDPSFKSIRATPLIDSFAQEDMRKYSMLNTASLRSIVTLSPKEVRSFLEKETQSDWDLTEKLYLFRSLLRLSTEEEVELEKIISHFEEQKKNGTFNKAAYIEMVASEIAK